METLALAVLETLVEEFGSDTLNSLSHSNWKVKNKISSFLEEEGEGFQLEGNSLGIWIEDEDEVYYAGLTSLEVTVLEKHEEYPVIYSGTDIVDYNRIVYRSENGMYANYDHNKGFYFDGDNYPSEVIEEWIG